MPRRLIATMTVIAVALAGAVVAPTPAQAAGKSKPKLTFATVTRDFSTDCGVFKLSHRKPVLTGSTPAAAKRIDSAFEAIYQEWAGPAREHFDYNAELDGSCRRQPHFKVGTTGSIYQNRYLSLAYTWTGDWYSASQDGVRTLTIDLKTGKPVKLSTFVSNKGKLFTWAACKALMAKAPNTGGDDRDSQQYYCPNTEWQRKLDGWVVSKDGVQVYGSGDQGLYKATLPWTRLIKASYTKAKKTTTKKVPGTLRSDCGSPKITSKVTVQGNLVTVRDSWSKQNTYYGVKSSGKKVGGKWRVTVALPDYGTTYDDTKAYVYFKSKGSSKAVKYTAFAYCAD
jgi:hypothetical protein